MSEVTAATEVTQTPHVSEQLTLAARAAEDKGATAPVALEVGELFAFADAFLLVTGSVERNVQSISDGIEEQLNGAGVRTVRREGREGGRWVLLDFGDLIVHIFHQEEREFYQLERLWSDCPSIDLRALSDDAGDLHPVGRHGVE